MSFKLSPSSLNLMKECPRCFWLDKHKKWKRPAGIFPSLPAGMDRILKEHFDRFMAKKELPPEICKNNNCEGMRLFDDKLLLKEWRSNLKGIRFSDEDGNVLSGAVDNLLVKNDKLIVLDFKTRGFALKEETADFYQLQLDVYNFLLRKNGYKTEDFAFLLFYVPNRVLDNGEVVFDTGLVKRRVDAGNAERVFKEAVALLNGDCPEERCGWCEGVER